MNTNPANNPNDDRDASAATPDASAPDGGQDDAATGEHGPTRPPDEYKRQHEGRQAMDRWMLHKALMDDFEDEVPARNTPDPQPPSAPGGPSDQPSP